MSVLVERTPSVHDEAVLAAVSQRMLPAARRLSPGRLVRVEVRAVVDLDPDAAARHRRAKSGRRVWTTPLGRTVPIQPRPYLHDPRDPRPDQHDHPDSPGPPEPPPF